MHGMNLVGRYTVTYSKLDYYAYLAYGYKRVVLDLEFIIKVNE